MSIILIVGQFIVFIFVSIFCFTIPGLSVINYANIRFSFWERVVLATTIGFVLFTLLSYLLLILNLELLLLPLIIITNIFAIQQNRIFNFSEISFFPKLKLFLFSLVFVTGIIGQLLVISPSGLFINGDLVFWSSHGHDSTWHIALMEEIKKGYPFQNPVFAGERLVNYHFFSDIAPADFNKYFYFSSLDLYFRFFPFVFSLLLGGIAFILGSKLGGNFATGIWATIFTYFAGSFGFIVTWLKKGEIGGESFFWASQVQSSIGNPPQIISNILVLTFLYLFYLYLLKKDKIVFLLCTVVIGSLIAFKVYAAIVVLIPLGIVGFLQIIKDHRLNFLFLFILSSLLAVILYFPNTYKSTSFLILEPWWLIRTLIVAPDRLDLLNWEHKRQTYIAESNWKRVIQIELTGFLIFFLGNLGMRFLGLWFFVKMFRSFFSNYFNQLFIMIISLSLILPLLFLQKGVASNTSQFLQYFLLLFSILSAITVSKILNRIKSGYLKFIIAILIIILAIPTQVSLIFNFYSHPPLAKITKEEVSALSYLKQNSNTNSVILSPPYNNYLDLHESIPRIWDWFDTAYISALSGRRVFLADTEQVDVMGYAYSQRLEFQKLIFENDDTKKVKQELENSKINYIYFPKILGPKIYFSEIGLKKVFENSQVEIWKVN